MPRNNQGNPCAIPISSSAVMHPPPISWPFLEAPYDKLVDCIAQWERKRDKYREVPVQKIEIDGTWEQRLNSLLPL